MSTKGSALLFVLVLLGGVVISSGTSSAVFAREQGANAAVQIVPETDDYATMVLGDPWDMNEFTDISQYLNQSGQASVVTNVSVSNGIFSATSVGDVFQGRNGWFHLLFPGYDTAVHLGRTGSRYPIDSAKYGCFYIAIKVNSGANRDASQGGPDQHRIFWFANEKLNGDPNGYGFSVGIQTYPEINGVGNTPTPRWQLLKIDLRTVTNLGPVDWTARTQWQGLRFEPTIQENVSYQVDWARLTDCAASVQSVSFTPNSAIQSVWLRPEGTSRHILVAEDVAGTTGTYALDTQGVAPGRYYVGFGTAGVSPSTPPTCCIEETTQPLEINATPIVKFDAPTAYSGDDYATMQGNPWDFSSENDFYGIQCASYGVQNGVLALTTPGVQNQPPQCVSSTTSSVSDPYVYLSVYNPIDPAQYRYLTYRMYTSGDWQNVPEGMIVRWVWSVQGSSGRSGYRCHLVSQDLPYDVGWQTYTVDLWDAWAGSVEQTAGECAGLPLDWRSSSPIFEARFDPNENITNNAFYQELDWVRLTKPITVKRGEPYAVLLSKFFPAQTIDTLTLYYTTDPTGAPYQHPMDAYTAPPPVVQGPYNVFLPTTMRNVLSAGGPQSDFQYIWDTSAVTPGEYYVCAKAGNTLNTGTFCSDVPVTVTP